MSGRLRILLLGSMAIAFVYLLVHAREPLRLNIGDPWSDANVLSSIKYVKTYGFLATSFTDVLDVGPLTADSYRYTHYPPLAEIFYGAVHKYLGVSDIGTFRLFGLSFSVLAMWLMFSYLRRLYSDRVGLIAITLFFTSLIWLMYADSIHQAPVMQCTGWLALWGLIRAIETRKKRHYAAAILGSCACFFTSYDYMSFLPAAVLFTVYVKLGNPFSKGNRHFVALCAAGCALGIVLKCLTVIGAIGWNEFLADVHLQFFERATSRHDRKFTTAIPTMTRRITLMFTPFAWLAAAYHLIRAIRAPSLSFALKETAVWALLPALLFLYVFPQLAASQLLASQVLLPFYAIGTALLIDRMLGAVRPLWRYAAWAWLVAAPLWGFYFMVTHTRSMLERDDVAKTSAYLAERDDNDFVMSNIQSVGHIQASFEKHYWPALDADDSRLGALHMMAVFETAGTSYAHAIIFTDPDSRFIDKSLWPMALPRRLWAVTGWPYLHRAKSNRLINEYDRRVIRNLEAMRAEKVLQLSNYAVYRVDRDTVMRALSSAVPVVHHIDFGALSSQRHIILGWGEPRMRPDGTAVRTMEGFTRCPNRQPTGDSNRCKTVLTNLGLRMKREETVDVGQLMLRFERSCDTTLALRIANPGVATLSINGFTSKPAAGPTARFEVPAARIVQGLNVLEIENAIAFTPPLQLASLDIEQRCPSP